MADIPVLGGWISSVFSNSVIADGRKTQREFAQSKRICHLNDDEARRVYYALVALATKHDLSLQTKIGIENVVKRFLDGCDWYYISVTVR